MVARMGIALQLYTIREETEKDFVGALRKVAAAGYEGVEFAGFGGLSAEQLKHILEELSLKAVSSHVGLDRVRDHLEDEVAFHRELGVESVVVPWIGEELRTPEGFKQVVAVLERAGKTFSEAGIKFGYHNHDFEFHHKVGERFLLDALFDQTPAESVFAELDTAWVHHGGQNAAEYVRQYTNRVPLIHLKDLRVEGGQVLTVPLGEGDVPLQSILDAAQSSGVRWIVVEQDYLQRDAFDSIGASREWLRQHYA